nr:hypothetical protein [Tanacetum cinerariifolium]
MINQDIKDSNAYNTYYDFAIGKVPPRKARKYKKVASPSKKLSPVKEAEPETTKRSMKDFHISQASGSGDGTDFKSGVLDEQQRKISGDSEDDNDDDSEDDNDDDSKGD